jgi:hypothetical protein
LRLFKLASNGWLWFSASAGSIVGFFVLVAVLLRVST